MRTVHEEEKDQLEEAVRKRMDDCVKEVNAKDGHADTIDAVCYLGMFRKYEWFEACWRSVDGVAGTGEVPRWMCRGLLSASSLVSAGRKRERISHVVRREVWAKTNVRDYDAGKCYTCDGDLRFGDMECGHVVAHALGGGTDVSNLMPVCRTCNRDMGLQNLEDYKRRILNSLCPSDIMMMD